MALHSANLNLLIEIDSDPITGSLSVGPGAPQPFSGWVQLTEAIEAARRPAAPMTLDGLEDRSAEQYPESLAR